MFRVGIIGAGHIAEKAARTLQAMEDMTCIAIGSRSEEKARAFAGRFDIPRAYGSYAALLADPDVDLVYIAVPHSCHFGVTRDAIIAGKPSLVEKSFMLNATEAAEIIALAREKGVFVGEAIFLHIGNFGEFFRFKRELLDGDAFLIEVAIDLNDNKVSKTFRVLCFAHAFFEISGHAFVGKDDVGIGGG